MVGPLLIGIAIVAALVFIGIFYGRLRRGRERIPQVPESPQLRAGAWQTPDEFRRHESTPDHGPGHEDVEPVEYEAASAPPPEEVPRDGRRRLPYEIGDTYPGRRVP